MAAKFEIRSPKAGEFNWVLVSQGRTLATGASYNRRAWAEKAIESLRKAAPTAAVDDTTTSTRTKGAAAKASRAAKKTVARGKATTAKAAAAPRKKSPAARKGTTPS